MLAAELPQLRRCVWAGRQIEHHPRRGPPLCHRRLLRVLLYRMEFVESFVHFPPVQHWQEQHKPVLMHRLSTILSLSQLTWPSLPGISARLLQSNSLLVAHKTLRHTQVQRAGAGRHDQAGGAAAQPRAGLLGCPGRCGHPALRGACWWLPSRVAVVMAAANT